MLTLAKLGAHSTAYYESTIDRGAAARPAAFDGHDYYSEEGEALPEAFVAGRDPQAAAESARNFVGVEDGQRLSGEEITTWFDEGVTPAGAQAGRRFNDSSVRGFDLTFAAPKSVSMLWALSEDEEHQKACEAAHQKAIKSSLAYLAEHAGWTRVHNPETGNKDLSRLSGLTGASYLHRTSRAQDPHLHSHVLLHNRQVREDGAGWGSVDGTSLYHETRAAGMLYQATLRAELARSIGAEWEMTDPDTGMADLRGIDREKIAEWSQRHSEIEAWAEEHIGETGAAETAAAQKATRAPKDLAGATTATLKAEWQRDDRAKGVSFEKALGGGLEVDEPEPTPNNVLELVAQTKSTFTRADLVEAAASLWPSQADPEKVREQVEALAERAREQSIPLSVDPSKQHGERAPHEREGSVRYSSEAVLQQEQKLLADATNSRDENAVPQHLLDQDLEGVSDDQSKAVRGIASSPMTNTTLVAPAGTGKTTSLKALRGLYEQDGREVHGLAPTGKAADVMSQEGATRSAQTIAQAMQQIEGGRCTWGDRTVVVIDEAGMVGTADLARLMALAKERGAKVVTVGDTEQLEPVKQRGGGLDLLAGNSPDTQRLSEVWRQKDEAERRAGTDLRSGDLDRMASAQKWYSENGRIHEGSAPAMLEDAYKGWSDDRAQGRDSLMLTSTREWAGALNKAAQADRIKAGQVKIAKDPKVGHLREGRAGVGDQIITRSNSRTLRAQGQDKHGNLIDAGAIRNGQRWSITGWGKDGSAQVERLDGGGFASLPANYLRENTELGYASTIHAAQGVTADTTHTVMDADRTGRSGLYVGMTRGKESNKAYVASQRVGEQSHQHSAQTEVSYRRGSAEEAGPAFLQIALREDRDSSALKVIAQQRQQYLSTAEHRTGAEIGASTTPAGQADQQRTATRGKAMSRMEQMRQQLREKEASRAAGRGSDRGRGL